jgi:hypothetical protein
LQAHLIQQRRRAKRRQRRKSSFPNNVLDQPDPPPVEAVSIRRPLAKTSSMPRFVYVVVVGDTVDEEVLRSDSELEVGDVVPFKGEKAIVERIGDLGRAALSKDSADAESERTAYRRLNCRLVTPEESAAQGDR